MPLSTTEPGRHVALLLTEFECDLLLRAIAYGRARLYDTAIRAQRCARTVAEDPNHLYDPDLQQRMSCVGYTIARDAAERALAIDALATRLRSKISYVYPERTR